MRSTLAAAALVLASCAASPPRPAALDTRNEQCASCRMAISDARLAAQLVAPSEEPVFFDDLGCLRDYLKSARKRPAGAVAYVADHRSGAWVAASAAVYTRVPSLDTPMASHVVAHADGASRDQDAEARGGTPLSPEEVFGPGGLP
jgi:copper chaperone NosL